jgi:hypothetical protein
MRYRDFGKLEYKVSALGFGAMRLPEDENGDVDRDYAVAIIREGIDAGINYVDTAPLYNRGQSEEVVGEALQGGYREQEPARQRRPGRLAPPPRRVAPQTQDRLPGRLPRVGYRLEGIYGAPLD